MQRTNMNRLRNIWSEQDFLSGVMFFLIGGIARYISYDYPLGSFSALGSGAFPMLLTWALMLIGVVLIVRSFFVPGAAAAGWNPWALAMITLAIFSFQFLIDRVGLAVSMLCLIALAALGGREARPKELAVFSAILIGLSIGLFIYGLGIPIKALPWN
ncbi:tripartite tricarboxylate transporter TctB family protein [Xanthobacter sp. DSM 24535]|uniref:tripartite tricarboxylate transporter TctB family protein n=1 Tax=Roseixanthobacter psychrophilus TaxID=3119917 RepID=UPI00372BF170